MKSPAHKPPRLGVFLLRLIYDEELFNDVYGDLYEIFIDRIEEKGKFVANVLFLIDALLSTRNYDLNKRQKPMNADLISMFKAYAKGTLRSFTKNKVYTILNISGLALGIAACLFILQYVSYERSYDRFHANYEDLYRVRYQVFRGGELKIDCAAAVPRVGPFMEEKMPEVKAFARVYPYSDVVTNGDIKFRENSIHMTDPSFLKMFSFPLISGNVEDALTDPNTVVISEEVARKYFGDEDPIGKTLKIGESTIFKITGLAAEVPENSHFKFDLLVSYETLNNQTRQDDGTAASETAWGWYDFNTYVLLEPGVDPLEFDRKFKEVLWEERGEDFEKFNFEACFPLQPIGDIHLYSNLLQESLPDEQGDGKAVSFLTIIAFFILLIAWINYINLSTARSAERASEVGVRKTLGATRKNLIYQFLTESFILNLISLIFGIVIVIAGIGYFNKLTQSHLDLSFVSDPYFWLGIVIILFVGSLISGLYPAFVLSSFNPVSVLKGKFSSKQAGQFLRRALVVFQFAASVTLIASTLIVYQQLNHMRNLDLGFDLTETMVVKGPDIFSEDSLFVSTKETFINELLENHLIDKATTGSNVPGDEIFWTNGIKRANESEDKFQTIYNVGVDYSYFDTYDIDFAAGRNYGREFKTDTGAVILNEAAVKSLGFENPTAAIDQKVTFWGRPKTIVGVVKDYHQMSAKATIAPIAFPLALRASSFITLKLSGSDFQSVFTEVQKTYEEFFPGNPFEYFFLDDFFNRQYQNDYKFSRVFTLFAGFAIFVACLGLFGLSSFNALKRTKEIGVRKVLGASILSIVRLLTREFLILVLISNIIAWPVIYLIMNTWLDNFAERIPIGITTFIIAGVIVLIVSLVTVSYRTVATAKSNPVKAIRYE
ncbi:MAG: ABC transporter permease [Saprospiraceae bacterium]|nr:ABC transporter permease [Saprospiraceae bacterium]